MPCNTSAATSGRYRSKKPDVHPGGHLGQPRGEAGQLCGVGTQLQLLFQPTDLSAPLGLKRVDGRFHHPEVQRAAGQLFPILHESFSYAIADGAEDKWHSGLEELPSPMKTSNKRSRS
ncbi:hypothetical protein R69927_05641 [Paraburkholderia domus]|nr:hypothetical protein R69927_05641 [Paraburkholderia domus]